ncbi:MAG: hypothetical protein OMM_12530, partial [Candidatus Magnetoglobus multicellularis str. Araruama]
MDASGDIQHLIQWTAATASIDENNTTIALTATLNVASNSIITSDITLDGTAIPDEDYRLTTETLSFMAGDTTDTITITILDDSIVEQDETIILTMGQPANAELGAITIHTITIKDNDLSMPIVNWTSEVLAIDEDSGSVTITATLSEVNALSDVSIDYIVSGTSDSADHGATNGTLTIPSGNTVATILFTITDDTLVEQTETLIITMDGLTNAEPGVITVHTISIKDNDAATTDLSHFSAVYSKTTGSSCLYAGKVFINGEKAVDEEDEVGIFVDDESGGEMLIGADKVKEIEQGYSGYYTFEIYGDNPETTVKDGAKVDDALIIKVWDQSTDTEYTLSDSDFQTESISGLEQPQIPLIWDSSHKDKSFGLLNLN